MKIENKADLLRLYEKNPALAFVRGMEMIRVEMMDLIAKEKKGEKGDRGDLADDKKIKDELLTYIKNYLPRDGRTPTNVELMNLIRPLIPVVKDGKTPSKSELLALIRPVVTALTNPERIWPESRLQALMKPLVAAIIQDRPEQIASKLNTLNAAIDQKVIRGLEDAFARINKSIANVSRIKSSSSGKSGGGMGNVLHESFNTSSATTTITTSSRIAGGGNALWLYYQGQQLFKGTDFTVGANQRTITLLDTLQDSTKITVTYIRT